MAGLHLEGKIGDHPVVLAGSAFALGMMAGLLLKDAAKGLYGRARRHQWHRDHEQTVTYDENLPDSLARREPAPEPGQPRYGGTGAMGVHPAAVEAASRTRNNPPW